MKKSKTKLQGRQIFKKFIIVNKIGTGAFGQIYRVINKLNPSEEFAVKLQPITSKYPQLLFEAKLYKYLHENKNDIQGIPKVYGISMEGGYNLMMMDLLGKSLQDIFSERKKKFSTKTILMAGLQILQRIQFLHSRGFLHRDIKPDNMLIGNKQRQNLIFLVDYGLSKKYIKDGKHIGYREGKQLTGTARYASISTHKGFQQSRRDDIESLAYVMMYFFRGILPWQNMPGETQKQKYENIMKKKQMTPLQTLCRDCPSQMIEMITYSRKLNFEETPDYGYLKGLLVRACEKNNFEKDGIYDWNIKND